MDTRVKQKYLLVAPTYKDERVGSWVAMMSNDFLDLLKDMDIDGDNGYSVKLTEMTPLEFASLPDDLDW